jgi:hypothetical protein
LADIRKFLASRHGLRIAVVRVDADVGKHASRPGAAVGPRQSP